MATAATEGKTTDANQLCDACEDHKATQYCLVCPGPLCDDCTKSHKKSKLTKDHSLCDLLLSRLRISHTKSGEPPEGLSKCPQHMDKEMEHFCNDCICFICSDCKSDHGGHNIKLARDDISSHRAVYHDHLKKILDEAHDLEQYKINLEKMIMKYEDTCSSVDDKAADLITEITKNAERLKKELRTVQGKLKVLLGDTQAGLVKEMDFADTEITRLRDFRKTDDCGVLSHALASSRDVLNKLGDYRRKITPLARIMIPGNILPYENEIVSLKDYIRKYFVMEKSFIPTIPKYSNISQVKSFDVANPIGSYGYRFCKSLTREGIMIHGIDNNDIRLFDGNDTQKMQVQCKLNMWNLVTVAQNEHIALRQGRHEISILDDTFKVIATEKFEAFICAICYYRSHEFVMCERKDNAVHFSIVKLNNVKSFVKKRDIEIPDIKWQSYMALYPDSDHCLVGSTLSLSLYKVSLVNSTVIKHDVSVFIQGGICSLCIDENGNTIIGDGTGTIHKFDDKMNHEIVAKISTSVRDVFVKGNHLLVSSSDNKIYVYS